MSNAPAVSIVICHWNAGVRTERCLAQISDWTLERHEFEVLVQDNASSDGSSDALRGQVEELARGGLPISFTRLDSHPGVTRAFNLALARLSPTSKYVMRLDNDVTLESDGLRRLLAFMESNPRAGVVGPKIMYSAEPTRLNAGAIWLNPYGFRNRMEDTDLPVRCDTLLGAVMLVRRSAIDRVGRWFDPDLFLFAEEPEFCWRVSKAGFEVFYEPRAVAFHDTALSTKKHSDLSSYLNHRNHCVVFNRMFPWRVNAVRNVHLCVRLLARSVRLRTMVPFLGFIDGLAGRPMSDEWWRAQVGGSGFRRP